MRENWAKCPVALKHFQERNMLKFFNCMIFSRRLQSLSAKLATTVASEHRQRVTGGGGSGAGATRCSVSNI